MSNQKTIVEWVFLVIALVLVSTVLACRCVHPHGCLISTHAIESQKKKLDTRSFQLRRQNRPFKEFFSVTRSSHSPTGRPRRVPRTTGLPTLNEPHRPISLTHAMLYPPPTPLPSAYRSTGRRTRGADIDEGGRRAGHPDDDHKDTLPAYDNVGGPPKYFDLEQLHLDLAGIVVRERREEIFDDTPRNSADNATLNSRSHLFRGSSELNHQSSSEPDYYYDPASNPAAVHHPV
jgi:hypothetical protein